MPVVGNDALHGDDDELITMHVEGDIADMVQSGVRGDQLAR